MLLTIKKILLPIKEHFLAKRWSEKNDFLITGLPRSGTTLTTYLLNKAPDVVVLNEPLHVWQTINSANGNPKAIVQKVCVHHVKTRSQVLRSGQVKTKHRNGAFMDNPLVEMENGSRKRVAEKGVIELNKSVAGDFMLGSKHPGLYTALLGYLPAKMKVYAIIRNPVGILSSWQEVPFSVSKGRMDSVELVDQQIRNKLNECSGISERQLELLCWFFEQYKRHLPRDRVFRYEDIVGTEGGVLKKITGQSLECATLENRNASKWYSADKIRSVIDALLSKPDSLAVFEYYSRDEIQEAYDDLASISK